MASLVTLVVMLVLVMDPLGNVPIFLTVLRHIEPKRRRWVIIRECTIAFIILSLFLFFGQAILRGLGVSMPALSIAGGIILFLIAIRMIFPPHDEKIRESQEEPFIVPLAIPLVAGPSTIATLLLIAGRHPESVGWIFLALIIASLISFVILFFSEPLRHLLGKPGLTALERLMGMVLTVIAVQMFLDGVALFNKIST